jgi:hypothetical protein
VTLPRQSGCWPKRQHSIPPVTTSKSWRYRQDFFVSSPCFILAQSQSLQRKWNPWRDACVSQDADRSVSK